MRDEGGFVNENIGSFNVCVILEDDMDGLDRDVDVAVTVQGMSISCFSK